MCLELIHDYEWTAAFCATQMSKILSRKFVILYKLCEDLLSKSKHYDWKLRAIKTTLYVAGGMKRSAPDLTEDKVTLLTILQCFIRLCMALSPQYSAPDHCSAGNAIMSPTTERVQPH